ncbi:penicillin acylase family protein [Bacillus sp. OTU530]|uniref:penicillin acylase family protein n=1 Tax=Bacillus sp. OTU530 TaxID=3043862 RepID=UPI00313B25E1
MQDTVTQQQPIKRKWVRFLTIFMVSILLLLTVAYAGGTLYIKRSSPVIKGKISLRGLQDSVTVTRDQQGVPHIEAKNLHDLYVSQGYVTAQDRLFQMDLSRRQASGELSEVMGEKTIEQDHFFLALGLRRAAEASYNLYSNEAKQALKWYADGVNLYIDEVRKANKWPLEFTLLGYEAMPWTPVDSLTIGKSMAFDLGGHWKSLAFRQYLLNTVSEEKALDLFPASPTDASEIIGAVKQSHLDLSKLLPEKVVLNELNGSNWVVSGSKTKSGKPILANSLSASLSTPSPWYETHLQSPELNVSGEVMAGIPGIVVGHNEFIAWGITNADADDQDLYIEKRNPNNPYEFLHNDTWEKAQVITDAIRVKDKPAVDSKTVITRHGPIISGSENTETALALKWTASEPSTELEAIIRINSARDWNSFKEALTYFQAPAQNFVFAAKDGTIAYRMNGKIPIRKKGDSLLPVPGWNDEYEWTGYIPWEELPTIVNPQEGFITAATNQMADQSYPYHIDSTGIQSYQSSRIQEVLQQKNAITVEDMKKLQMDQLNLKARSLVPILLQHIKEDELTKQEQEAISLLKKWDFTDDRNLAAPLLFHTWMQEIGDVLFKKDISEDMQRLFEGKEQVIDQLLREAHNGQPGPWIQEQGGLDKVLKKSLAGAVQSIVESQGASVKDWRWGDFHRLVFTHPLSYIEPYNYLFNPETPIPIGGSGDTVQSISFNAEGLADRGVSSYFAIDLHDITTGYHIVAPGQSGHIQSEWYHDQMKDWVKGTYHTTSLTEKSGSILHLLPAR